MTKYECTHYTRRFHYESKSEPKVFSKYGDLIDVTMIVFHVHIRYKKINKMKIIEIINKGIHLFKVIIINHLIMKKSNQNCG